MKFSDFMVSGIDYRKGYEDLLSSIETTGDKNWNHCILFTASNYLYYEGMKSLYNSKAKDKPLHFKAVKDVLNDCKLENLRLCITSENHDYGRGKIYSTHFYYYRKGLESTLYLSYDNRTNLVYWDKMMECDLDILEPSSIRSIYERQKAENEAYIKEVEAIKAAYENKRAKDTYIGTKTIYYRKH